MQACASPVAHNSRSYSLLGQLDTATDVVRLGKAIVDLQSSPERCTCGTRTTSSSKKVSPAESPNSSNA